MNLDAIDLELIRLLQQDGRATNKALAEHVGLSPSGCMKRIQQLEEEGYLQGYHAAVSPDLVGLNIQAFLRVALAKHDRPDLYTFIETVKTWPEVVACYAITGDGDFLLQVLSPDLHYYRQFLTEKLAAIHCIRSIQTHVVLGTEKKSFELPLSHLAV